MRCSRLSLRALDNAVVQLKYFGDSRDFFKYDLITAALDKLSLRHYVFIPMLTEHRQDNEGKKVPRKRGDASDKLLKFIVGCNGKNLRHWEAWLKPYVDSYRTLEPVNNKFFSDQSRVEYWKEFQPIIGQENALVFIDPDTGLETGTPTYLRRMGREKYILNYELQFLISEVHKSSALMLYQHLPNNKHLHEESVTKKLQQVHSADKSAFACAYREDDLAFLFVSKNKELHKKIQTILNKYHASSNNKYKSLHT